jgi:chorismate-pyruvate lyase
MLAMANTDPTSTPVNNKANNNLPSSSIGMLRIDLQDSLRQTALDPRQMSSFQRILLTTDGTVTEILEAYLWEAIQIVKLYQDTLQTETAIPYLEVAADTPVLVRKVLLRGKLSHKNYIYAESITLPERLDPKLKEGLLTTGKPIGRLMLETRTETFREILSCKQEDMGDIAQYYDLPVDAKLISRTYRIFAGGHPIMLITEKFPATYFKD